MLFFWAGVLHSRMQRVVSLLYGQGLCCFLGGRVRFGRHTVVSLQGREAVCCFIGGRVHLQRQRAVFSSRG